MNISNFRELLLRKTSSAGVQELIKLMRDSELYDRVLESLEKMAKHMGDRANMSLRKFAMDLDPHTADMMRDAIGHHASRYKKAIQQEDQSLANKHAKKLFNILYLARQAQPHSHGRLSTSYVEMKPWERQSKLARNAAGKFSTDTVGIGYKGNDFYFLRKQPHESYHNKHDIKVKGHNKAYPMEEIRINGVPIHIEDIPEDIHAMEEHEFDSHPILNHFRSSAASGSDASYLQEERDWNNSGAVDRWFDRHDELRDMDPESYAQRGSKVSDPVHSSTIGMESTYGQLSSPEIAAPTQKQPTMDTNEFEARLAAAKERPNVVRRPAQKPPIKGPSDKEAGALIDEIMSYKKRGE